MLKLAQTVLPQQQQQPQQMQQRQQPMPPPSRQLQNYDGTSSLADQERRRKMLMQAFQGVQ
jgi:hypothetical protein